MDDWEIVEKLLNGSSLRTVMTPDPSLPSNSPEHIEGFDLPHVIITKDHFWGKSETAHLVHVMGEAKFGEVAFCYANLGGGSFAATIPRTTN